MRRGYFGNTLAIGVLIAGLTQPNPLPLPNAEKCDRCGEPMLLDALGEMWMCANPLCAAMSTDTPECGT